MRFLKTRSLFLVLASVWLVACAGGDNEKTPTASAPRTSHYSGVAVDDRLLDATAFLDLNGNGRYDKGEPQSTTSASGAFSFSATQNQMNSHSVIVQGVIGGAVDQNASGSLASGRLTMVAPQGAHAVVSPLTTLITAKMSTGLSRSAAIAAVQSELALGNVDLTKDYVALSASNPAYMNAYKMAVAVTEILKNIDAQSSTHTSLADKFSLLLSQVTSQLLPVRSLVISSPSVSSARSIMVAYMPRADAIYSVGGTVTGLTTTGLVVVNGMRTAQLTSGQTSFQFSRRQSANSKYAVTIQAQPSGQICSIQNGLGKLAAQSITNVNITCTEAPGVLAGTISGLTTTGLVLKNGVQELPVSAGASTFQFPATIATGASYAVTVKTQPDGLTCSVFNSAGVMPTAGIQNVQATCASSAYLISGSVSGLTAAGLTLQSGSETLTLAANASTFAFTTPIAYGGSYAVTLVTQPAGYFCTVSNGTGIMGAGNITSLEVVCEPESIPLAALGNTLFSYTGQTVSLSGASSSDSNNGTLTYNWSLQTVPPGSTAALSDAATVIPSFVPDLEGIYVVSLSVSNLQRTSAIVTQVISVAPASDLTTGHHYLYLNTSMNSNYSNELNAQIDAIGNYGLIGCYACSQYSENSICNAYGPFGSASSGKSIWNSASIVGSASSPYSPWNTSTMTAPFVKTPSNVGLLNVGMMSINPATGAWFPPTKSITDYYRDNGSNLAATKAYACLTP